MSVPSSPIPTPVHTPAWTRIFLNPKDTGSRPDKARLPSSAPEDRQIQHEAVLDCRFRVLSRLGSGGMACVYLCEDLALRSRAAVKVLQSSEADLRRRFLDEVTILANLRHPHLVQVLAVGETPKGAPYMAMEYLGESLDRQLRAKGPLPWDEAVSVAVQVASALELLHRAGVIHRDVKPSNIAQLRGITGHRQVKLIDLGIARVEALTELQAGGTPLPPRRRTAAGKIIGTPGYVPPEAGLAAPAARFDIYSLGVTLYQLCTGRLPDPAELRSMEEALPGSGIPQGLEAVVRRAMAVLPEDRFETVAELRRELAAIHSDVDENLGADLQLFDGCYELLELLGVGAKAEVWRAYHRDARCYVAIKILREDVGRSERERARFVREARVLAAVESPAIPQLVDCRTGPDEPRPFIAMELRRGATVASLGLETLDVREVIAVGLQVATALGTLHQQGILHRDLNRSNVLIDRRHGETVASLIDFGEAELLDRFYALTDERYPTPPEARTRPESEALRLLEWTAPEAKAGHGWTAKSDVYSLGLLLFRLLTGKVPIKENDGWWGSPAELVPESEGPLAEAILGALNVDPALRFDALGLLERLNEAELYTQLQVLETSRTHAEEGHKLAEERRERPGPGRIRRRLRVAAKLVGIAALCLFSWSLGRGSGGGAEAKLPPDLGPMELASGASASEKPLVAQEDSVRCETGTTRDPESSTESSVAELSEPEPSPSEPPPAASEARSVSKAAFRRRVRRHHAELEACVHGGAPVKVRVVLAADGSITRVDTGEASPLAALCLRDALDAIDFPRGQSSTHRIVVGGKGRLLP